MSSSSQSSSSADAPAKASSSSSTDSSSNSSSSSSVITPPPKRASSTQMIVLAVFLGALALVSLIGIGCTIHRLNQARAVDFSAAWEMPDEVELSPGPATFRYDAKTKELLNFGPIDHGQKLKLRELFEIRPPAVASESPKEEENDGAGPAGVEAPEAAKPGNPKAQEQVISAESIKKLRDDYYQAIDELAFKASVPNAGAIILVLLLGALGGILGAVLRSLVDFVGNACYKKEGLDLDHWWPLYATRPMVGGILGFVIVVMFKADLFVSKGSQPTGDGFWWLGIAVLGGFSTLDVTQRLRLAAKALFGVESDSKKGEEKKGEEKKDEEKTGEERKVEG